MNYRLNSQILALCLVLLSGPYAYADDYFQGKLASSETDEPDTYRVSGIYGFPLSANNQSSLELDVAFSTNDIDFKSQTLEINDTLDLRPESAGLYFSQSIPLYRGAFCSDLYFRSGVIYEMNNDTSYSSLIRLGQWVPSIGIGLSHRYSNRLSYLADFTHTGDEGRFNVGFSYRMDLF